MSLISNNIGAVSRFRRSPAGYFLALAVLACSSGMAVTSLPLEFKQRETLDNLQSQRGMPLSEVVNNPVGSDGRLPDPEIQNESGSYLPVTPNQFSGLLSYGGGLGLPQADWLTVANSAPLNAGTTAFSEEIAEEMRLPVGRADGSSSASEIVVIQRKAQIGAPYVSRQSSYLFGSVIPVPDTYEDALSITNGTSSAYWLPEPYSTNNHENAGYYWSPNARVVYAVQPGPIEITWIKAQPYTSATAPAYTNLNGAASYLNNGSSVYLLYTVRYVVSSSAVKTPRKMYWTEGAFRYLGKPVSVPKSRVPGGVKIVYHAGLPRTVASEYLAPGQSSITDGTGNQTLQNLRTFYYEDTDGYLHAYNTEGRVFMELLGDARPDGMTCESLGFEIVDVIKQPLPGDVNTELGEQLQPPGNSVAAVTPEVVQQDLVSSFVYAHSVAGSDQIKLYAEQETENQNDCMVHWMELGVQGLKWPSLFARYRLVWPNDVSKYSHYIRPAVATEAEAMQTAVSLSTENVPIIANQDAFDRPRAKLTSEFKFYTFLDEDFPAHRSLLRFTSGNQIAYERVFSWLDGSLRSTNFADSVAQNFAVVAGYPEAYAAFLNYAENYIAYTNRLTNYTAYTNQLANYVAYTNRLATHNAWVDRVSAYTNWTAQVAAYIAYTNQLAGYNAHVAYVIQLMDYNAWVNNRSRGVNGVWTLYARDDTSGDDGTLGSWTLRVISQSPSGVMNTNNFTMGNQTLLQYNFMPVSTVTVSGITNTVLGVQVILNSLTHYDVTDIDIWIKGPRNSYTCLMSDVGVVNADIFNVTLTFSDPPGGVNSLDPPAIVSTGIWRPTNIDGPGDEYISGPGTILDVLLLAAPTPVAHPGPTSPPYTEYPGASPPVPGLEPPVPPGVEPPAPGEAVAAPGEAPPPLPGDEPVGTEPAFLSTDLTAPRVVNQTVSVGARINAPEGELGSDGSWAGRINPAMGNLYNAGVYVDPLASGFAAANAGAIIPVNAVPGKNRLEVWWFRSNTSASGHNAGNTQLGFATIYWPSVLGRYTIVWPNNPREIVLASNIGSGTLDVFEAQGTLYYQNDAGLPGYNPNEEHAILSGGTAFATRDDLNITNGVGYSSHPFVLVNYTAQDGRPSMSVFQVLREKPEAGYVFDYIVPAGQIVQPPMPLPLLAKPVEGSGDSAICYNSEPDCTDGDLPGGWNPARDATGVHGHYRKFAWQDPNHDIWVYRGLHAGLPALQSGTYDASRNQFTAMTNTAVVGQPFLSRVQVSRQPESLILDWVGAPEWLSKQGLSVQGTPDIGDTGTNIIQVIVTDTADGQCATNVLVLQVAASGDIVAQGSIASTSVNPYTGNTTVFTDRPPFLAVSPTPTNSFTLRYYYKTEPGFAWPGVAAPPAVGSIVPYLRPLSGNTYVGDGASKTCASLDIVYRPTWPTSVPTMNFAETLSEPKHGLPGVCDWSSAQILYQQSIASSIVAAPVSAVLFDPTREKVADLDASHLEALPSSVATTAYQGKKYFPLLPPHLVSRLFFDPNRGAHGSLVLTGEFKQEIMGESYFLLNVMRGSDLASAKGLCSSNDTDAVKWDGLVESLSAEVETFHESPTVPGTYVADPALTVSVGVGDIVEVGDANTRVVSYALSASGPGNGYITLVENGGSANVPPGAPVALHIIKVGGALHNGELKIIAAPNPLSEKVTFQHSADLAGRFAEYEYEWKIGAPVDGMPPVVDDTMSRYLALTTSIDQPRYILGGAGIQALTDNYVVMRFRSKNSAHPLFDQWSDWTTPALCEGWIKRVLAGINPFSQRTSDLFNNSVNTDVSMLTQAGHRWEGDVALNADTLDAYGLIEIYETVLRRGRMLSIDAGYNYGPANDALLLACGYLNDLYMMVGNEAWADAANPTIGIGTQDATYGDIATALFAFKGQEASLLEEELALLRGRDDFLQPGVDVNPVYNRLVWNYTRGIDAGEVIYALNYNIQEKPDSTADGIVNAADAAYMFPMGHGDAYGHYLTALKGYYSLLANPYFDWVPRIEAVSILGQAVSVDYQDERKFAAAAVAFARAGQQILDLTWRRDFQPVGEVGWDHLAATKVNSQTSRTRYWGADHWATRTGQGTYLNWVVGNAMLPDVDPDPAHEGIQKVDRTTVNELTELTTLAGAVQTSLDNAEGGLTPLGLPEGALALDIDPNVVVGTDNGTHFEQIYGRAKVALNNAVASFDDAKDVTRMMRSEQDTLADFQAQVAKQELAYNNELIELYGTPYPDDIGAGKTYSQGYTGPDLMHFAYVDQPEYKHPELVNQQTTFTVDIQQYPETFSALDTTFDFINDTKSIQYNVGARGYLDKPASWTGKRTSPGKFQQVVSEYLAAYDRLQATLEHAEYEKRTLNEAIEVFNADLKAESDIQNLKIAQAAMDQTLASAKYAFNIVSLIIDHNKNSVKMTMDALASSLPSSMIAGLAMGGDLTSGARAMLRKSGFIVEEVLDWSKIIQTAGIGSMQFGFENAKRWMDLNEIAPLEWQIELRGRVAKLADLLDAVQHCALDINQAARELDDAQRAISTVAAAGDRIQLERETFRRRSAVVVQGYRTRDAAFRIFRNEKLERYKTLFDLAARYAFLAANAYDYETGLLNTDAGRSFVNRIVQARALGVVNDGEPQYAGSDSGDPGLSSALAEMKADWDVLRGRLGFNNPDAYGTIASLRTEALRILPTTDGDAGWRDVLQQARMDNILEDADVRRNCMQIDNGSGLAVPGLVLSFSTTISTGYNLFGQELAAGDHAFNPSAFATKIFAVGVALEGYRGMDNPAANSGVGGVSPSDPSVWYLDPLALSATPYIYLIPVGTDAMRSPPLGDASTIRAWTVNDIAIPMPFNIGASDFSTKALWQSSDSLTEPLFAVRKHQSFRPVSTTSVFSPSLYGANGTLQRSQYTNNRLVGRSAWNSQWKLVIPGNTLLNDPKAGLDRFIQTVKDAKLYFVTYSYSGN